MQQRQKLRDKMQLKMVLPEDTKQIEDDAEMFSLANIRTKKVMLTTLLYY
jgi:AdoMet-dependent rRNA methyltransferase SPB1